MKDHHYIEDEKVFKAVSFARHLKAQGEPIALAIHKAAKYYKVSKTAVAKELGNLGHSYKYGIVEKAREESWDAAFPKAPPKPKKEKKPKDGGRVRMTVKSWIEERKCIDRKKRESKKILELT
jgi:hypothetical protein